MKLNGFANLLVFGLMATVAVTGCKKKPGFVTPLPAGGVTMAPRDQRPPNALPIPADANPSGVGTGGGLSSADITGMGGVPANPAGNHDGWPEDREMFRSNKAYFAFDSASVRPGETAKVQAVADYLKANADKAVKIEGHCDERGTEQYNLSLGERRAVSLREELIKLGIDPTRVDTITYGESRPDAIGHDESAFKLNRRGEFIVLSPLK
jgi:peptidoglycan-associated lipoprotein